MEQFTLAAVTWSCILKNIELEQAEIFELDIFRVQVFNLKPCLSFQNFPLELIGL